jgi:hypothetical protein
VPPDVPPATTAAGEVAFAEAGPVTDSGEGP